MSSIYKKNIVAYEQLYKTDSASSSYEVRVKVDTIRELLPKLKSNANVMELGYGTGELLHFFAINYPKSSITGIELVKQAESLYHERYESDKNIQFALGNAEKNLRLPNSHFDLILASHMLEHIKNENRLLDQIFVALRKNGYFVLAVPEWGDFENHLHYRQYSKKKLVEIGEKFDWSLQIIKGDGFYLNKLFYRFIGLLPLPNMTDVTTGSIESSQSGAFKSVMKSIYYNLAVPTMLKINKVDTLLCSRIDNRPMQWIGIYKKN